MPYIILNNLFSIVFLEISRTIYFSNDPKKSRTQNVIQKSIKYSFFICPQKSFKILKYFNEKFITLKFSWKSLGKEPAVIDILL